MKHAKWILGLVIAVTLSAPGVAVWPPSTSTEEMTHEKGLLTPSLTPADRLLLLVRRLADEHRRLQSILRELAVDEEELKKLSQNAPLTNNQKRPEAPPAVERTSY